MNSKDAFYFGDLTMNNFDKAVNRAADAKKAKGMLNPETKSEAEASAKFTGYVRCPNNIYGVPGSEWYAGEPGLPEMRPALVFINDGCTEDEKGKNPMPQDKYPVALYYHVYGKPSTLSLNKRFATFADYMLYAIEKGNLSEPGMPAHLFGD